MRWLPALLLLSACAKPQPPARDPSHPDLTLERVTVRSWDGTELRVVTTADSLSMTREGGAAGALVAFDAGVTVVRDGTHVTAPLVRGNFLAGDLEGEGGVSLRGANGLTAASPRVAYSRNLGLASSDAGVVVQQPGLVINAAGFTANVVDETAEFQQADTRFTPR